MYTNVLYMHIYINICVGLRTILQIKVFLWLAKDMVALEFPEPCMPS